MPFAVLSFAERKFSEHLVMADRKERPVDFQRRKAMLKIGRFATYTAPAMTVLLVANRAEAASSGKSAKSGWQARRSHRREARLAFVKRLLARLFG